MNNVVRLFASNVFETDLSNPDDSLAADPNSVWSLATQLECKIENLSNQVYAIENALEIIDDIEMRSRLNQSTKLSRETLSKAMIELNRIEGAILLRCMSP